VFELRSAGVLGEAWEEELVMGWDEELAKKYEETLIQDLEQVLAEVLVVQRVELLEQGLD
jgi:hypothetical protein